MEVFQQAQEDGDECIAMNILVLALLKKHVRLIQQQHRTPRVRNVHDLLQLLFENVTVGTQITRTHGVEWTLEELGDALTRQRLADTRWAMQNKYEALALALHDVVDGLSGVEFVARHERLDDGLAIRRYDEAFERAFIPLDVADAADGKFEPLLLRECETQNDRRRNE